MRLTRPSAAIASSCDVVKLTFGGKDFAVHKSILCHFSPYFSAAFDGGFREATEGIQPIQDLTDEDGQHVVSWLYCGRFTEEVHSYKNDLRISVFADKFGVLALARAIFEGILLDWQANPAWLPTYRDVNYIFENLPISSPICKLFMDRHAEHWTPDRDEGEEIVHRRSVDHDFLEGVMLRLSEIRDRERAIKCRCCHSFFQDYWDEGNTALEGPNERVPTPAVSSWNDGNGRPL